MKNWLKSDRFGCDFSDTIIGNYKFTEFWKYFEKYCKTKPNNFLLSPKN